MAANTRNDFLIGSTKTLHSTKDEFNKTLTSNKALQIKPRIVIG